jgi:uncharacterized protein YidB (DUF937 family)
MGSENVVPGGNVAKPLIIALLALFASRYFSSKGSDPSKSAGPAPTPRAPEPIPTSDPGNILDGLGGLVKQFQQKGLGDTIDTWINPGTNKPVSSGQISDALGSDVVDQLAQRTGLSRDEVISELAKILPSAVDKMTPNGRLPTTAELQRLMG